MPKYFNNDEQDMIAYAHSRMDEMSQEDLKKLFLVTTNQYGISLRGGKDYKSEEDGVMYLCEAIERAFTAYDKALLAVHEEEMDKLGMTDN